jgi:hypothetical protein
VSVAKDQPARARMLWCREMAANGTSRTYRLSRGMSAYWVEPDKWDRGSLGLPMTDSVEKPDCCMVAVLIHFLDRIGSWIDDGRAKG